MIISSQRAKEMGAKSSRKGIPNKSTKEIRGIIQTLLENNLDKIQDDLDQMTPEQRVKTILSLAKYVLPIKKEEVFKQEDNFKPFVISFK